MDGDILKYFFLSRVRMFSRDKLNQSVVDDKWNQVKVVCNQPFNKHTQYGLSFISVTGTSALPQKSPAKTERNAGRIGAFKLKSDADDDFSVGSYFNRMKRTSTEGNATKGKLPMCIFFHYNAFHKSVVSFTA